MSDVTRIETSGHDRLRAAADRVAGVYTTVDPTPQDIATAALLRAVADRDTPGKSEEWKVAQIINAAADLAAIILGDTDERA